jgi:hypothetical protein
MSPSVTTTVRNRYIVYISQYDIFTLWSQTQQLLTCVPLVIFSRENV